ncbi:hypothetical protein K450DRAFT_262338 [Umbelopsis ramanniana AG]|uniref:tRNA pseudouridine synthase 1 n=1 Tax=Umbelopsis ramanniana AG TaxID=1314678 RepID=A0AAD5H9Z9_UMBRA|nr:uncharacterized protein K450DRAFT_262338 [Umbelopsis ramanniana AG]KAI8575309.1 hypothetical protein K450DRAFT_262338 [Umbelopsis ramanniana AG]
MLARITSLLGRSRTSFRAMSSTSQSVQLPEKRSTEEMKKEEQKSDSAPQDRPSAESSDATTPSAAAKRIKTAKDRKDHFDKKQSWKAKDWATSGKKPVRDGPAPERKPKKKVAVLVGFCGTGYQGMQINPTAKSIEGELFNAFCKTGAVSEDNSDDPKKVSFTRAARTDKGVHAAGNVVSLKLIVEDKDIVSKINSYLPDQIRVWGYVQTMRNFNAKTGCDSRVYEYLLPTYTLMAKKPIDPVLLENAADQKLIELPPPTAEELAEKRAYRASEEQLKEVANILSAFEGTNNFHNYTIGRHYKDRASSRYIMSFKVDKPQYVDNMEWLSLKIHGQSFMLHQIRKMVGILILAIRSGTPAALISKTFGPEKLNIPKAPALGLLLERPIFETYNKRISTIDEGREPVKFDDYEEEINAFKSKYIYSKIYEEEVRENVFDGWLRLIDGYRGVDYGYLNPEGVIPETSVIGKGQERMMDTEDIEDAQADDREG